MWKVLFFFLTLSVSKAQEVRSDPAPIIYPGQVNIGVLSNVHGPPSNGSDSCGPLRPEAVQRAMAVVWAAHQANFRKEDPQELNIGVYIFDTCGREDVAERQVYRLLGHVGHVQTTDCSEKRIPPLFAVITEGATDSLQIPLKLLDAFQVPVISTSMQPLPKTLSTAPSTDGLARAATIVLRHLNLLDVAVMAEDNPPFGLLEAFSRQSQVSGMQAIHLENNGSEHNDNDFTKTLKIIADYGQSQLKAAVFLIGSEQALHVLKSIDDKSFPQMPWVVVTPSDISSQIMETFQKKQIRRLRKVLLLSPESIDVPEFQEYFEQLLEEDTIKYHPLLVEFLNVVSKEANSSTTLADYTLSSLTNFTATEKPDIDPVDVSSIVKAVWTLSTALKTVQRRSCRRGTDCLLYLRRSISSYVGRASASLDDVINLGSENLERIRLNFDKDGSLTTTKYVLKEFTSQGKIKEVGYYSDDEGLQIGPRFLETFSTQYMTPVPITSTPEPIFTFQLKPDKLLPTTHPALTSVVEETTPPEEFAEKSKNFAEWRIFEDIADILKPDNTQTSKVADVESSTVENDLEVMVALRDGEHLQSLASSHSGPAASMLGPSYTSEQRSAPSSSSSNMRSVSLTSHQEPKINREYKDDSNSPLPSSAEDVKVMRPNRPVSAWLGRPWALSVLGVCGFLILATLYVLVFLMVKACEGTLKKTNCCLAGTQLIALLCLYVAAAIYTWKPSSLLCGLQRLIPNTSLAFCYGCLLLKGMFLRAQSSLGLGGSVNLCNKLLTLLFIIGVQVALEVQWWLMRPPGISQKTLECLITKTDILQSQGYVALLLLVATAMAISTRRLPYNQSESRSLIATTLACLIIFLSWEVACWLLPDSSSRNIAAPSSLMATALAVLLGIFGPQLFAIHKYGGFPHKPLSYADSLSTVFTMFKDLDNASSGGTTARGKKNAKTLETPFAAEGTRNPLYNDYNSAYP